MKKLRWLLLMPFFIACNKTTQQYRNSIKSKIMEILVLHKQYTDSLEKLGYPVRDKSIYLRISLDSLDGMGKLKSLDSLGKLYQCKVNESDFQQYIFFNDSVANILWEGDKKKYNSFLNNIIQHEAALKSHVLDSVFLNNLYKRGDNKFHFSYDESAVADFEKCFYKQQQHALLNPIRYFITLQSLGIAYHILGEKDKALHYYRMALESTAKIDDLNKKAERIASAHINLAEYFLEYGQPDTVIVNIPPVLKTLGIKPKRVATLKAFYAEALYNKGNLAYRQQLDEAWGDLQHLSYDGDVEADELGKKSDVLRLYGKIAFREGKYDSAKHYFTMALDTCQLKSIKKDSVLYDRSYAKLLLDMAAVYDSTHQYDTALYYSQFALKCVVKQVDSANIASNPSSEDLYIENTIMEALDYKAVLLQKKYAQTNDINLLQNAVFCYEGASKVEQKLMNYFTYDSSRAVIQNNSKQRSAQAIAICYRLHQLTSNNTWSEKAFQFSENSKALILLEAIKKNIRNSSNKDNPLFKKIDSLQLQLAYAERESLTGKGEVQAAAIKRKKELDNLLKIELNNPSNSELSYKKYRQQDTALLASVRKTLLTSNRHLVEFFCNKDDRYLFVVKKSGDVVFSKLDTNVNQQIRELMDYYTANNKAKPSQYKKAAYQLYQSSELSKALPVDELLIIPDGSFNEVPFDALVTDNAGDEGFSEMNYLLKQATISYGYSAASLLKQLDNNTTAVEKIAAFAPVFANGERNLTPLHNSETEVKNIKPTFLYIDTQATVAKLLKSYTQADIIHIASHASADTGANANPRIEMYDGSYFTSELYATPLPKINLVVLSACQTNQGNIDQSEGTLSLARGFYYAGAKNIVASLWKVDDKSTADIVQQFYGNSNGHNYAAKLCNAKKWYLDKKRSSGKTAPFYWAAMMHIGGFGNNTEQSNWWKYGIGAAAVLLLAGGIFYWQRRKR